MTKNNNNGNPTKYYVMRLFKTSSPLVLFTTTIKEDAITYAGLMKRNEPEFEYAVVVEL